MATRREQRKGLTQEQQIGFIHDDLDRGAKHFVELHREVRATLATVIMILIAVIGTSFLG